MDPILNYISFDDDDEDYSDEVMTSWIKEDNIFMPSTTIKIQDKLDPGMYSVFTSRDRGIYCKEFKYSSDELITFKDSIIDGLFKEIELFWEKKELYAQNNLVHKRGILLEGYAGTGKSAIISLLSNQVISKGGVVFKVLNPNNLDTVIDFMLHHFRKIEPNTPIITIIEGINQYEGILEDLLDLLDGKSQINNHIIIGTTNDTSTLSDALLRPSRFDLIVEIKKASKEMRREYLMFKKVPENLLEEMVNSSKGFTLAELKEYYISVFLLDYSLSDACKKIKNPLTKRNFLDNSIKESKMGI